MKARDFMATDVPTISMRKTVTEAVRLMKEYSSDDRFRNAAPGLVVVNERGELVGIFTPLRIITTLLEKAKQLNLDRENCDEYLFSLCAQFKNVTLEAVMERQAISVTEDACITDVAELFATHRFQRVPVVRDKKVIGVIYRAHLMFALTSGLLAS